MQAMVGRRLTDRILVIPSWQRVCGEVTYVPPPKPSLDDTFSGHGYARTFATILYQGLWLQRAVVEEKPTLAEELAAELTAYSEPGNNSYEDSPRERVGAAFLLWPFHAARYYGYSSTSNEERLKSRSALCEIQAILYNNVRTLLDILRLWFDCYDDANLRSYVADPMLRRSWRPSKLTENAPDLCAVDFLIEHLLEIMKARPLVRRAIESVQEISLNSDIRSEEAGKTVEKACADVRDAFKALRFSQMTVFYNPDPSRVRGAEIPLTELVHGTTEDPIPSMLIPFEGENTLARNFRLLASNIYSDSASNRQSYPSFFEHRRAVINLLRAETDATSGLTKAATRFVSDGETTRSFLSSEPPTRNSQGISSNGDSKDAAIDLWPIWYNRSLAEIELAGNFPDWSDWDFWWRPIDSKELARLLFPGEDGGNQMHRNHHKSAYWDELARCGALFESVEIPRQRPTNRPSFGHLMELLLRRECETRTSFFFALAQTYEENNARLCHFVGGTFLGLERPGIPFSEERFRAIAARVRGLVMAVAHYTATHAVKIERGRLRQEQSDFRRRLDRVVELLRGKDDDFNREGDLLFASRAQKGVAGSDHNSDKWRPSRQQIKRIFNEAEHLREPANKHVSLPRDCDRTWKALFYLGGDSELHFTLRKFLAGVEQAVGKQRKDLADRDVVCEHCFRAAVKFLLGDKARSVKQNFQIQTPLRLPSRPGIRFLFVLCRFITHVQSESGEGNASITGVELGPGTLILRFSNPDLVQYLEKHSEQPARFSHTVGRFQALKSGTVFNEQERGPWNSFLNSDEFAAPLQAEFDNCEITLRWN